MWKLENHEGVKYWYEGELIERIKAECNDKLTQAYDVTDVTKRILKIIQEYEKEGK